MRSTHTYTYFYTNPRSEPAKILEILIPINIPINISHMSEQKIEGAQELKISRKTSDRS